MADNGSVDLQPNKIGGCEVLKVIGTGCLGTIYRVRDPKGQYRALKLMHAVVDIAHGDELFRKEARILAAISSSHVIQCFGEGVHEGRPYILLEWIQSELNLRQLLAKGPLSPEDAIGIIQGISRGLADTHAVPVLHRDLKPENIMLTRVTSGWHVKLIDFNVAEFGEESRETNRAIGSPNYMAPEQARGETLDEKCDVFSLGCILYEMLTGKTLVNEKDDESTTAAHARMRKAPIGKRPNDVPEPLWAALQSILVTQPEKRPSAKKVEETMGFIKAKMEEPMTPLQLPPLPTPEPPRVVSRAEHHRPPPQDRSLTAWGIGAVMVAMFVFVGGSILHQKIGEYFQRRAMRSDSSLDVTVRLPAPPPDPPVPTPPEPEPPIPGPVTVRRVRRLHPTPAPIVTTTTMARPAPVQIRGAQLLDSGNYRIPHPDDWGHVSPGRRRTMCAAFRNRGVQGQLFHQFCDEFLPEE